MDIGNLLRSTRNRHGLTQARLALRAGTDQAFISRVERGTVSPTIETAQRLFAAMGEELAGTVTRSRWQDSDVDAYRAQRRLTADQRLAQALPGCAFAAELRGAAVDHE